MSPTLDADGIDAAFLYPSLGLFAGAINERHTGTGGERGHELITFVLVHVHRRRPGRGLAC